ncbi:outer-membrane lipoprotein carrier protein LolA [Microvirga guangxiensis]|uniref:Outer membrane lipoprotein-sorting protein n=1 Tax=Microvirga guangxiensis TaxID=549386 RepID=A0A1G5BTY9_9HYPH|nr:outer-membrane lipoprotein carrier protein LolA [Microvirga guangxiensis]SCX93658.1 Outer membrane lipoprotein-sorting protein [Microvirga guangxiensis]
MLKKSLRRVSGLALLLALTSPLAAQQRTPDPLTRFLDGIFKPNQGQGAPAAQPQVTEPAAPAVEEPPKPAAKPKTAAPKPKAPPRQQAAEPKPQPEAQPSKTLAAPKPAPAKPEVKQAAPAPAVSSPEPEPASKPAPAKVAEPPKPARSTPAQAAPTPTPIAAATAAATPVSPPNPSSPAAALERVNAYFNAMDTLSAYFVQKNPNGQQVEGTLSVRRPGQLHFAYAPPSTLEVVSDGRNVAIRDKKLGTNDVYPVGQTPLKFLVQDNVDLARDTKVRDVQIARDGMITVSFDDSATLGGTSKITLRFDSRANALKQWTIVDAQGYETTVVLSGLNVVQRKNASAGN